SPNVGLHSSLRPSARYWVYGSWGSFCCSAATPSPSHRRTPNRCTWGGPICSVIDAFGTAIADLIAHPVDGRPVPYIGWLGVVVLFTFLAWMLGNWKVGLLTLCGLLFMGLQGLWQESMETLGLTIAAVAIALLIGIPLGIWAGISDGFNRFITPVLDFMQILPSFVYLAPLTLAF